MWCLGAKQLGRGDTWYTGSSLSRQTWKIKIHIIPNLTENFNSFLVPSCYHFDISTLVTWLLDEVVADPDRLAWAMCLS